MMSVVRPPHIYNVDWSQDELVGPAIHQLITALHRADRTSTGPDMALFLRRFEQLQRCDVPSTALTPAMIRLLYELSYAVVPRRLVGIGTFCGSAMNMLAAGAIDRAIQNGENKEKDVAAIGLDIDASAIIKAHENAKRMQLDHAVQYIEADGLEFIAGEPPKSIDLLYLDFDDPVMGKHGYADAIERARDALAPGSFVFAHDAIVPKFHKDLERLRATLRASGDFDFILDIPIDRAGLLVATGRQRFVIRASNRQVERAEQ